MPFLGFSSQSKRSTARDHQIEIIQKRAATSDQRDLYAQVDFLQLEMSRLCMKIAFMKADNLASIDRRGNQEDLLSNKTLSTLDTTAEPRSSPYSTVDQSGASAQIHCVDQRMYLEPPPPITEISIPMAPLQELPRYSSLSSRNHIGKLLVYRVRPSRDQGRNHPKEQEIPQNRRSLNIFVSKTSSRGDCSSRSRGSRRSSGLVRYRKVKRIIKQKESPQPKLAAVAEVSNVYDEAAVAYEEANPGIATPSNSTTSSQGMDRTPLLSVTETPSLASTTSCETTSGGNLNEMLLKPNMQDEDVEPNQATQWISLAPMTSICDDGRGAVVAEIRRGVTLKPVPPLAGTKSNASTDSLLLTVYHG